MWCKCVLRLNMSLTPPDLHLWSSPDICQSVPLSRSGEASGTAHKAAVWPFTPKPALSVSPSVSRSFLSLFFLFIHLCLSLFRRSISSVYLGSACLVGFSPHHIHFIRADKNTDTHTSDEPHENMARSRLTSKSI